MDAKWIRLSTVKLLDTITGNLPAYIRSVIMTFSCSGNLSQILHGVHLLLLCCTTSIPILIVAIGRRKQSDIQQIVYGYP